MKQSSAIFGRFFNFRLFVEGLKRLRVTTTAVGILSVVASALVPIATWIDKNDHDIHYTDPDVIDPYVACIPMALVIALAPFFFLVLFSFLQKRKQSDFFHAIPYTRTCVYVSFVAASLVSIFFIQILSALVASVLWFMVPNTVFNLLAFIPYIFTAMLGAAMLSAFMMLALTVSSTGASCMLLFALFATLVRVVMAYFATALQSNPLLNVNYWLEQSFLSPFWFYPLTSFASSMIGESYRTDFLFNPATIIYSVIVTLLLFAVAGVLYNCRRSEMAGNPAPGKRTQALFRILFTLPLAFLTVILLLTDNVEDAALLLLVGAILLCYFLYELVTTKRVKNMGKAAPGLGIVLLACVAFGLTFVGTQTTLLNEKITADEIATVTLNKRGIFQGALLNYNGSTIEVDNPEVIAILADRYDEARQDPWHMDGARREIVIKLKNGRTLHRSLGLTDQDQAAILQCLMTEEELAKLLSIPDTEDIQSINGYIQYGYFDDTIYWMPFDNSDSADRREFIRIFRREFDALSEEKKKQVLFHYFSEKPHTNGGIIINVSGYDSNNSSHYYFENVYCITSDLPKTQAYLLQRCGYMSLYNANGNEQTYLSAAEALQAIRNTIANESAETYSFSMGSYRMDTDQAGSNGLNMSPKDFADIMDILTKSVIDPSSITEIQPGTHCIFLNLYGSQQIYGQIQFLVKLSDADSARLFALLKAADFTYG